MTRLRDMRPGFMLDHMWTGRHLSEYLDDDLDDAARARVERHAHLCPKCRELIDALRQTLTALRRLAHHPPRGSATGVAESVIGRLRNES
jgi:anti-sigma factor RsiW